MFLLRRYFVHCGNVTSTSCMENNEIYSEKTPKLNCHQPKLGILNPDGRPIPTPGLMKAKLDWKRWNINIDVLILSFFIKNSNWKLGGCVLSFASDLRLSYLKISALQLAAHSALSFMSWWCPSQLKRVNHELLKLTWSRISHQNCPCTQIFVSLMETIILVWEQDQRSIDAIAIWL